MMGVVETWLKNGDLVMEHALSKTNFVWIGKDRKRRRGGGLGCIVRKECRVKLAKVNKCENILWLKLDVGSKIFCGFVYLPPDTIVNKEGNEEALSELERDVMEFRKEGAVIVMGDMNSRVGELPNQIAITERPEDDRVLTRTSLDKTITSLGRQVMERMNATGLVLLNGLEKPAEFTYFQDRDDVEGGRSVIDFIWVRDVDIDTIKELKVWEGVVLHRRSSYGHS